MTESADSVGFNGILGRAEFIGSRAELRFYPFQLGKTADAQCVLQLELAAPDCGPDAFDGLVDQEIDVVVSGTTVEIEDYFNDRSIKLQAQRVVIGWVACDAEYLFACLRKSTEWNSQLHEKLRKALLNNHDCRALVIELLRRAEIKATASDEHKARQGAAIAVLERVLRELGAP